MKRISILHMTDTLLAGGLERVAVNIANSLPRDQYDSHLCVTRSSGPLAGAVEPHVRQLHLERRGRFDALAMRRLGRYLREERIRLIHAHGTSLFFAAATAMFSRGVPLLWHIHLGRYATDPRAASLFRIAARLVSGTIAVTEPLAEWARARLKIRADRVWYIPNFVCEPDPKRPAEALPGRRGKRIVCVANIRPPKDHTNLIEAMSLVVSMIPDAHLILVGNAEDQASLERVRKAIADCHLEKNVTWLGPRSDVPSILRGCDVGVLSSVSEGLPLALIEYGMSGLAAVSTRVGQCAEVLEDGQSGLLAPPSNPAELAKPLVRLLRSRSDREMLAARFAGRVRHRYSIGPVMQQVCAVYATLAASPDRYSAELRHEAA